MAVTLTGFLRGLTRTPETRDEEPIRDELYSVERLEQYAATLAAGAVDCFSMPIEFGLIEEILGRYAV